MLQINLFDSNFAHAPGSVGTKTPTEVEWVRGHMTWDGITIFTDQWMFQDVIDQVQSRYKLGWLHEGKELRPHHYELSKEVRHKFDAILTYDDELLDFDPGRYMPIIRGGVWTPRDEWCMPEKTKMVSLITSHKYQLSGHQLRHRVAGMELPIHIWGARGRPFINDKAQPLKDYRFSIIIEACRERNFFSEHLLDCIAFGTIPIYWGCPNIGDFLDETGILQFHDIDELQLILSALSPRWYEDLVPAAKRNLARLPEYEITEDWMLRNTLQPFLEALEVGV